MVHLRDALPGSPRYAPIAACHGTDPPGAPPHGGRNGVMTVPQERDVKLLSLVDVLEQLSEEELRELAQRCTDISLRGREDFYRPELHDGGLFLIKQGHVRVYLKTS